jgi:hypothetical protein
VEQILKRYSGAPYKLLIYIDYFTFDINPVATFILDESGHALGPVVKRDTFDHIAVDSEGLVADVQNSVHQLDQSTFCLVAYCDKLIA